LGRIKQFNAQGVYRCVDPVREIEERVARIGMSLNGYLKQLAALRCVQRSEDSMAHEEAQDELRALLSKFYDRFSWDADVSKRMKFIRLGHD
jgi:hypothetical protein